MIKNILPLKFKLILTQVIALLLSFNHVFGQFGFQYSDSIIVKKGADTLNYAWTGGLNHAQFSTIDYNFDGLEDLFIFDRSSNQIILFKTVELNGVKSYEYVYNERDKFPSDLRYRTSMVDYNNDGLKDIFTYGIGGVKVYKNIGSQANGLKWELADDLLSTFDTNGGISNLYVSSIDIPAYVDIDQDGDIDILTFHIGGQRVEYHKNISMETYGIPDSLIFEIKDPCWGKFIESDTDNNIQLNSIIGPCDRSNFSGTSNVVRHAGSSLLILDLNGDNAMDIILGDVAHNNLTALTNGAAPNDTALMTSMDANYPSNTTPLDLPIFPAPYFIDVNHDGIKDLIVGTNASGGSENLESVWYYQNLGNNSNPNFSLVKRNFLQDQMIENGKGAIPVLVDLNEDGLLDLLISSNFRYLDPSDKISKVQYFQNTGTTSNPEFTFISDDWLNLSTAGYGLRMHPAFGDLYGDGKVEMILGTSNGRLHLYSKSGTGPEDFVLQQLNMTDNLGTPIEVNAFASPQIFDLNNDGLLDIIIGRKSAGLSYYQNIGTPTLPSFELVTDNLGNIDMGEVFSPDNYAVPAFVRHNDTTHLFVGNQQGSIYYYTDIDENLNDGDNFMMLSDNYSYIQTSAYSAPFISNLRIDGRYEMLVGTDLGGVWSYIAETTSDLILSHQELEQIEQSLNIYPNPSKTGNFTLEIGPSEQTVEYVIYDNLGRVIAQQKGISNSSKIDLSKADQGVYTLILKTSHQIISSRKMVIQ
ncbi:T9SS type A sorting domain-containing protein [Brumimicrobium aurantiacum]|uniref:T9SS C-terminal target domain-containing protein n=1 Tax=Brumimicrobium aurantiacum TaxID=1737063 RepID=A0A3E1EWL8_9FLAO|nr:T9SS type A sorting domain-containing protein [Brumimicrobium aurantiacum]RFC53954.1 T9SS C-terminal target domain-containing protein [Brumimicrobium aurantiacum]